MPLQPCWGFHKAAFGMQAGTLLLQMTALAAQQPLFWALFWLFVPCLSCIPPTVSWGITGSASLAVSFPQLYNDLLLGLELQFVIC